MPTEGTPTKNNRRVMYSFAMAIFLGLISFMGINQFKLPEKVSAKAPAGEFSSGRAMELLKNFAVKPHPIGSAEHNKVRDYIISELKSLGFMPQIQKTQVMREWSVSFIRVASIENIMVRIPGTNNSKAVMLVAHYDSVPTGPGTSDDGSGVVTLLETLRALKNNPPLKNDVIFLFTDGEEIGLMGAKAFADQHPWAKDVGVILNFEASGSGGSVMMFETSNLNGWLVNEFAEAAQYPVATSLAYEIYKRMPNDTDLSIFKKAGYAGLNFAFLGNRYDYHTMSDNLQNIDERTLQQDGSYALSLTKHFGNLNLDNVEATNSVYFNLFGYRLITYSTLLVIPFAIIIALFFIIILVIGFRKKMIGVGGTLAGFFAFLLNLVLVPVIIQCFYRIIIKGYPGEHFMLLFYNNGYLLLAAIFFALALTFVIYWFLTKGMKVLYSVLFIFVIALLYFSGLFTWIYFIITIVIAVALYLIFRKGKAVWNLTTGSLFGWLVLTIYTSIYVPGVSYLFAWPLFLALIPIFIVFLTGKENLLTLRNIILFAVFAIIPVLWFSSLVDVFNLSMGIGMIGGTIMIVSLLSSLLIPQINIITSGSKLLVPGIFIILSAMCFLLLLSNSKYNERYRKMNSLFYLYDADVNESFLGSTDLKPDNWISKYLTDNPDTVSGVKYFPRYNRMLLKKDMKGDSLLVPVMEITEDTVISGLRTVKFHLSSERKSTIIDIYINPASVVVAGKINGLEVKSFKEYNSKGKNNWLHWGYFAVPDSGINISLTLQSQKTVEVKVCDICYGLSDTGVTDIIKRPAYMMPNPFTITDEAYAIKSFSF